MRRVWVLDRGALGRKLVRAVAGFARCGHYTNDAISARCREAAHSAPEDGKVVEEEGEAKPGEGASDDSLPARLNVDMLRSCREGSRAAMARRTGTSEAMACCSGLSSLGQVSRGEETRTGQCSRVSPLR
jgi:hypothetical protein